MTWKAWSTSAFGNGTSMQYATSREKLPFESLRTCHWGNPGVSGTLRWITSSALAGVLEMATISRQTLENTAKSLSPDVA